MAYSAKNERPSLSPPLAALIAGTAGTVALNITTYADMALRGRGSSGMPAKLVLAIAQRYRIEPLLDEGDEAQKQAASHRREALGALLGYANGLGLPVFAALLGRGKMAPSAGPLLGAAAMAASDVPAASLGVTDPTSWGLSAWLSDIVPHLVYGVVAASTYRLVTGSASSAGSGKAPVERETAPAPNGS